MLEEIQDLPSNKGKDLLRQESKRAAIKAREKESAIISNLVDDIPTDDDAIKLNDIGQKLFGLFTDPPDPSLIKLRERLMEDKNAGILSDELDDDVAEENKGEKVEQQIF